VDRFGRLVEKGRRIIGVELASAFGAAALGKIAEVVFAGEAAHDLSARLLALIAFVLISGVALEESESDPVQKHKKPTENPNPKREKNAIRQGIAEDEK
jgi:hypothetical protein